MRGARLVHERERERERGERQRVRRSVVRGVGAVERHQRRAVGVLLPVPLDEGQLRHEGVGTVGVERELGGGGQHRPALPLDVGETDVLVGDEGDLAAGAHRTHRLLVLAEGIKRGGDGKEWQQERADVLQLFGHHC